MAVERRLVTAEEFLALPNDHMRHELIDGEVRTMAPASGGHGDCAGAIHVNLGRFCYETPVARVLAAETGFIVRRHPDRVRAPDVAVVRTESVPERGFGTGFIRGAPDLAVEVVSPGDADDAVHDKVRDWLAAGSALVWVVYATARRLVVHRADGSAQALGPDDEVDGGEVLPGFRMKVADLLHPFKR